MQTITIVLTRYTDPISELIYWITGRGYTHASISLIRDGETMYSFNKRGFCEETVAKHRRRGVTKSMRMQFQVSDAAYDRMQQRIGQFCQNRTEYAYTWLGVVLCLLHIPVKRDKRYFCSQFVAEMLSGTGALKLKKAPSLYMPNHFCEELLHCGQLRGVQYNFI